MNRKWFVPFLNVLFRNQIYQYSFSDFPDLLLTFNITEYLNSEERAEIFTLINNQTASEEYTKHIDAFN